MLVQYVDHIGFWWLILIPRSETIDPSVRLLSQYCSIYDMSCVSPECSSSWVQSSYQTMLAWGNSIITRCLIYYSYRMVLKYTYVCMKCFKNSSQANFEVSLNINKFSVLCLIANPICCPDYRFHHVHVYIYTCTWLYFSSSLITCTCTLHVHVSTCIISQTYTGIPERAIDCFSSNDTHLSYKWREEIICWYIMQVLHVYKCTCTCICIYTC